MRFGAQREARTAAEVGAGAAADTRTEQLLSLNTAAGNLLRCQHQGQGVDHEAAAATTTKSFLLWVYLCAGVFMLLTSALCMILGALDIVMYKYIERPFLWSMLGIMCWLILRCWRRARTKFPFNLILVCVTVALFSLWTAYTPPWIELLQVGLSLIGALALLVLLMLYGALAPNSGHLPTLWLMLVLVTFLLLVFIFACVWLVQQETVHLLCAQTFLFALAIVYLPYHTLYIHGRLNASPIEEKYYCALIIFICFVAYFSAISFYFCYYEVQIGFTLFTDF
ncbi:uncharacterized protein LOC108607551 [Drosophila busckii]|uniref:uncharacterized protein LOC108607551 n=1 Tax=Drosophila busckii TaxID=30019 RepID=UPI00143302D4|nr:uncharacterized protein LOC108607551 [Drosophila busckii]